MTDVKENTTEIVQIKEKIKLKQNQVHRNERHLLPKSVTY